MAKSDRQLHENRRIAYKVIDAFAWVMATVMVLLMVGALIGGIVIIILAASGVGDQ